MEITNTIITELKRLVTTSGLRDYSEVVSTNIKAYKYKWAYEDFAAFEEFNNWQEWWKFIIEQSTFNIKDNDLIIIWTDKYLIKNAVLIQPDEEFYNFYQCTTFKNND